MLNRPDAIAALNRAWPIICNECLSVLGSELHYQAMIYHALRQEGQVPLKQIGMNVKQYIPEVKSALFKQFVTTNHPEYRHGFEPIPDLVIFSPKVAADWRRRKRKQTIECMLLVMEIKASERLEGRLSRGEITLDIRKLAAHREEVRHMNKDYDFYPVMLVIDSARDPKERMTEWSLFECRSLAKKLDVEWRYISEQGCQIERSNG